jgi:hypothetical protein
MRHVSLTDRSRASDGTGRELAEIEAPAIDVARPARVLVLAPGPLIRDAGSGNSDVPPKSPRYASSPGEDGAASVWRGYNSAVVDAEPDDPGVVDRMPVELMYSEALLHVESPNSPSGRTSWGRNGHA